MYYFLMTFIGLVSLLDLSLVIYYYDFIEELNPICLFIMKNFGLGIFTISKITGTSFVLLVLYYLRYTEIGNIVCVSLFFMQVCLLVFLFH